MNVGTSPWSVLLLYTVGNLVWLFGVHPNSVMSVFFPIMMAAMMENQAIAAEHAAE